MASVITDIIDCPQCGLPANKNDYYIVGEERVVCNWCGYSHLKTIQGTETKKGYGSIHLIKNEESDSTECTVRLKTPSDIAYRHKVIMDIQENYDTDRSSFYVWNEERGCLECLIGNKPKTLDEVYQEQSNEAEYYRQIQLNSIHKQYDESQFTNFNDY